MARGDETRKRIHDAALTLFAEHGVTETSVRDLAQAADIAEGTLYRHYPSKDELVADLFRTNYAAFADRLRHLLERESTCRTRIEALVAEFCRFHDADPTLFRFLLLVQHQALPRMTDGSGNPVTVLHGLIQTAMEAGEIPSGDTGLTTALVLGLLLQPAIALVYGRLAAPLSPHAPTIAAACWRVLTPA